jgi:hypothetical protein
VKLCLLLLLGQIDGGRLSDDFEGGLLAPQGQWGQRIELNGNTIGIDPAAAHRGAFGLRLNDPVSALSDQDTYLVANGLDSAATTYRIRYWVRGSPTNDSFQATILATASNTYFLEVRLGQSCTLAGHDRFDAYFSGASSPGIFDGAWHLVEAVIDGPHKPNGRWSLYVDGAARPGRSGLDFAGRGLSSIYLGKMTTGPDGYFGTIDYDDVRLSPLPHASRITVAVDAGSACGSLEVGLVDSESAAVAPAPYPVDVTVRFDPPEAALFADPQCISPAGTLLIPSGTTSVTGGVRFLSPGRLTLRAEHVDFLGGESTALIKDVFDAGVTDAGVSDGGSSDGGTTEGGSSRNYTVGCGCQAGVDAPWPFAVIGLLLLLGQPRGRANASRYTSARSRSPSGRRS